ncbi:unnamed protein product [Discosporangium mesarthrocarpum]
MSSHKPNDDDYVRDYENLVATLISSTYIAGVALLDDRGRSIFQRSRGNRSNDVVHGDEGPGLVSAVWGLTDDGLCRHGLLTCKGQRYRVFGGTPRGIYAVGPNRKGGIIVRSLPGSGVMVIMYRRPYLAQQVVPPVERFIDVLWASRAGRGSVEDLHSLPLERGRKWVVYPQKNGEVTLKIPNLIPS